MAESSRRFRKSTSRSIAATSAIALALGGLSVVGPGPLAPHAAAATLSGGIRDKSGAVDEGAQQASDLPAGSCIVNSDKPSGSQAGFSWNTLEPSGSSPDKTLWGLSVSFDNSKDRTFADWSFTNAGGLVNVLGTGTVPSMKDGTDFPVKPPLPVTAKADEVINITGSGRYLRNLNLNAELTDEKVKQFASASVDSPVRYAWQSNYTKDNPNGPYATQGDTASFTATVNPWPSENIECNPISVSWEESQRFVVNPGNENKVGHINVPALSNEGVDDSLSRMVVEAYDEDGNLIGTSDTEASGGEQNLRIDGNGDIFFTWPEYVDSDHATDKNVNFSVLAQPRSVEQLQEALAHNNSIDEQVQGAVFDSSNSLDRYSKANVVGSGGVALDNTDLHNPKYDENEKHITSEVGENGTGEDEGRHVVTFTPVVDEQGNTLQDLVDKFNATVKLDDEMSNIFDGWDATLNDDYTVTVKSPVGAKTLPGTFAQPFVKVTYSNGSTDLIPLLVIVDPNDTQVTNVNYPRVTDMGQAGQPMTATGTPTRILGKGKPVTPKSYEITNAPAGWDVKVAPDGTITAIPPADAKPGDFASVDLKVTYPDGTVDTPSTTFVVGERKNNADAEPSFPERKVYPDEETTSPLTVEKPEGVEFAENDPFVIDSTSVIDPDAPGFEDTGEQNDFGNPIYKVPTENGDWYVSLDGNGDVITKIPATAKPGDAVNVPVKVTYADGSSDTATAPIVVVDNKRQVPFDIEYKFDPDLPSGEYRIDKEGVPGEEVLKRDQNWSRVKDPENEIVSIGTKQAEASDAVTWAVPIPYSTVERMNPDLAPGEVKVVQIGENGIAAYEAKFTGKNGEATVAERTETVAPVDRIIEYGPRLDDQELVTTTTRQIPFETTIVFDNTLEAGQQVVDTQGVVGEEKVTSTQKLVDGKPSGDPVVTTTTVTEKQDAVIRVGTKTEGANTVEHTEPVPYETKVEYDPNLPAGTYEVVTPGKAGEKTVKVTQTIVNSQVTDTKREEDVTTQPVTEVIKVGTKQATATDKVEWTEPIPFSTVVRPNPDLKPGEVKTVQEGVNGEAKYTATFEGTNGQATVTESKDRTEPTDKIVEYGPTIDDQTLTSTTTNPVPFNTTFVADPNLPVGEQVVDKQGENGVDTVTATQEIKDGKPVGEPTITTERTKEPVNAVVRVGTKTTGETVNSYEAEIPFPTRIVYDPSLKPGESKVTQEGKPGTKKVTITQPVVNSAPNGEATVSEEQVEAPTEQIVTVGTKPDEATNTVTWTAQVPYNTVVRPNTDLKPGEVKTVQEGEYGEKTFTADFSSVGSDAKVDTKEEVTKQPKDQIIEYGPTIDDQTLTSTTTRSIQFETEIIFDDTLAAGEQKVDQQGENGEETITSTQEIKDGKPVGEPTITTERTKEPVDAVVRVGTKKLGAPEVSEVVDLPFTTRIVFDPTLEPGTEVEDVPGENGQVKVTVINGKLSVETVKEPVQRVVRVGSRPADGVEWTEEKAYEVKVVEDPTLEAGKYVVAQEGKPGRTVHKADGTETITEPTDHIIKVGTKGVVPAPDNGKGSSDTAKRCVSNAFAANSPILWLLPVALLGAIGYGVNEAFGPQIQQASAQINEQIRRSMPDFGFGIEQPEWVRQINAQVDAINRQFAPLAKQLEPVGIVLGAIAAVSLTGVLIAQACSEDGFDNGLTALSSKK